MTGPNVRRTLDGFKTQTRRVASKQPRDPHYLQRMYGTSPDGTAFGDRGLWCEVGPDYPDDERDHVRCPFGAPGDRLWVRETFYCDHITYPRADVAEMQGMLYYRADATRTGKVCELIPECECDGRSVWKPGIHMPRWASRLTLELTNVRAERLGDIAWHDIRAEGVACPEHDGPGLRCLRECPALRRAWRELWDSINDKRPGCASRDNPWVWVLAYKRCEAA
jgi:hypothetical protein